jgi:hypothetical protein
MGAVIFWVDFIVGQENSKEDKHFERLFIKNS